MRGTGKWVKKPYSIQKVMRTEPPKGREKAEMNKVCKVLFAPIDLVRVLFFFEAGPDILENNCPQCVLDRLRTSHGHMSGIFSA